MGEATSFPSAPGNAERYVGTLGRHLAWQFDESPVPLGARFRPDNIDTTTTNRARLPDNFLLSQYVGYGGVNYRNWGARL